MESGGSTYCQRRSERYTLWPGVDVIGAVSPTKTSASGVENVYVEIAEGGSMGCVVVMVSRNRSEGG